MAVRCFNPEHSFASEKHHHFTLEQEQTCNTVKFVPSYEETHPLEFNADELDPQSVYEQYMLDRSDENAAGDAYDRYVYGD